MKFRVWLGTIVLSTLLAIPCALSQQTPEPNAPPDSTASTDKDKAQAPSTDKDKVPSDTSASTPDKSDKDDKEAAKDDSAKDKDKGSLSPVVEQPDDSKGKQYAQEVEATSKLIRDPTITEYVNRIGQNLVRNSDAQVPFTIKVVDSDEVNAFALPGGFFYV